MNHHNYNKNLKFFARENRKNFTKSEACMWKYVLSASQMLGYGFRRQRPIGNYIADFVCLPLKLIIEVDGFTHDDDDPKDDIRDKNLQKMGFTTLRFSSWMVLNRINDVAMIIVEWINSQVEIPPPNPRRRGKPVG